MPTPHSSIRLLISLVVGLLPTLFPLLIFASTDPQSATPSATATIPSFAVSSDTQAPTTPILVSPTNGTHTTGNQPEFHWQQSSDPNSNAIFYTLHLNGVATYLGISNIGNSSAHNYTARLDQSDVKMTSITPLPDGEYDWHVTATDLAGNSSRSTSWRLIIDTTPPPLTLTQLDIYSHPPITTGSIFDIAGPKDVYFTFTSEPSVSIQLDLLNSLGQRSQLTGRTNAQGNLTLSQHLSLGTYQAIVFGHDQAGNQTFLPDFIVNLTQASVPLPGGSTVPIPPIIHDLPATLTHLPATISQLKTSSYLSVALTALLAVIIFILLFTIWNKRYNLILLQSDLSPLPHATIYHSRPPKYSNLVTLSRHHRGRLYIPHLTLYSTLTIRTEDTTLILSLSSPSRRYTVVV